MSSVDSEISDAQVMARALWFVDNSLVDRQTRKLDWRDTISVRLRKLGLPDERVIKRTAEQISNQSPSIVDNLNWFCEYLFELRHGLPVLRSGSLFRRLIRIIDPDILVCFHQNLNLPSEERFDWGAIPVRHDSETVNLLRDNSVDTHIHLAGTLSPLYFWVMLMSGEIPLNVLATFPAEGRGHAAWTRWRRAIIRAMWIRLRLAITIQTEQVSRDRVVFRNLPVSLKDFSLISTDERETFMDEPETFAEMQEILLSLSMPLRLRRSIDERVWPFWDPLRLDNGPGDRRHYAEGERRLLYHLREYLGYLSPLTEKRARTKVENNLLAYLRTRNAFHQALMHDDGTCGLMRFVETFGRRGFEYGRRRSGTRFGPRQRRQRRLVTRLEKSRMIAALDAQLLYAFDTPFPGKHRPSPLRRIEMRVSIPPGNHLLRTLRAWLEGIRQHLEPSGDIESSGDNLLPRHSQVGLVFHLIKGGNDERAAFRAVDTTRRLCGMLKDYPKLRRFIVGFDAAGEERGTSPRIFAKSFACIKKLQATHRPRPGRPCICLGLTYHVGEDVDDMLTGLRHLDEAASLLLGNQGGRLGHALVLGEDPVRFYQSRGQQSEPALGSHLLDLVWAWGRLSDERQVNDLHWLHNRIWELTAEKNTRAAEKNTWESQVADCYRAMGLDRPQQKIHSERDLLKLLGFQDEREITKNIVLRADAKWLELVGQLQCLLRQRMAKKPICIEANPTSNLIVGGYTDYGELPYEPLVADDLALSLNTDDPGLFAATLPGEFVAMYQALSAKMTHRKALEWLHDRCFDADQSSFLGPHVPVGADALETLKRGLEKRRLDEKEGPDALFEYAPD